MNDDDLTGRLRGGPPVPQVRDDAISLIMAGADARRRRRSRAAIVASVAAVALTIALITGGSVLLSGGVDHPVPGPVAPSTTARSTPTTSASSTSSPQTGPLKIPAVSGGSSASSAVITSAARGSGVVTKGGGAAPGHATPGPGGSSPGHASSAASSSSSTASITSPAASSTTSSSPVSLTGTGILHLSSFRLPSGNIGCRMTTDAAGPEITCAIADSAATLCGSGWDHSFQLDASGAKTCTAGPLVAVPEGPVLRYGQANVLGGIVCVSSEQSGLTCTAPMFGSFFAVGRAAMSTGNGEGGFQAVDLGSAKGSNPATVTIPAGGPLVFASADLSVVCKAQISTNQSVLCDRASTPSAAPCTDANRMGIIVGLAQGVDSGSSCGGPSILSSVSSPVPPALAKVLPGTRFLVGPITCTAYASSVSCVGDGNGFSMSAAGYGPPKTG